MPSTTPPESTSTSTRPYLVRALYEWCTDNGLTPYVAVFVDDSVRVPREFVKNNEIVLNIGFDATSSLQLGNDFIEFKARFSGTAREIMVPMTHVMAIYARESGQGMSFPMTSPAGLPASLEVMGRAKETDVAAEPLRDERIMQLVPDGGAESTQLASDDSQPPKPPTKPRPALTRVK